MVVVPCRSDRSRRGHTQSPATPKKCLQCAWITLFSLQGVSSGPSSGLQITQKAEKHTLPIFMYTNATFRPRFWLLPLSLSLRFGSCANRISTTLACTWVSDEGRKTVETRASSRAQPQMNTMRTRSYAGPTALQSLTTGHRTRAHEPSSCSYTDCTCAARRSVPLSGTVHAS